MHIRSGTAIHTSKRDKLFLLPVILLVSIPNMSTSLDRIVEEMDEPEITSLSDQYSDMDADLKLVSSDEHVFRIPSYALQASS